MRLILGRRGHHELTTSLQKLGHERHGQKAGRAAAGSSVTALLLLTRPRPSSSRVPGQGAPQERSREMRLLHGPRLLPPRYWGMGWPPPALAPTSPAFNPSSGSSGDRAAGVSASGSELWERGQRLNLPRAQGGPSGRHRNPAPWLYVPPEWARPLLHSPSTHNTGTSHGSLS